MLLQVAPLAGAWIEIKVKVTDTLMDGVAPLAGAWIEIKMQRPEQKPEKRRSPRGSVD